MPFEKASHEVLRYLFHEYQNAPTVCYLVDGIAKRFHVDPVELTDYMITNQWIRERWVHANSQVSCRITIHGIEEIKPAYVREKLQKLIGTLGHSGGSLSLMDILQQRIEEYAIALDMVKQLESLGLVRSNHPKDIIIVQLTEAGWRYYHKSSRTFFTLMSVA